MKIKGRETKPLSKEDREVFDWIGQKLQDIHDGKDVYLTDEEVEKDRQEWLKTQPKEVGEAKKSFSSPCQQEDMEEEIGKENKGGKEDETDN